MAASPNPESPMPDRSTLEFNLSYARYAVEYTRKMLAVGSSNKPAHLARTLGTLGIAMGAFRAYAALNAEKIGREAKSREKSTLSDLMRGIAEMALSWRMGNCGEHAAVAFLTLERAGVKPIELLGYQQSDHAFVVIGRAAESNLDKPATWGDDAAICDPWGRRWFAADEAPAKMVNGYLGPFDLLAQNR